MTSKLGDEGIIDQGVTIWILKKSGVGMANLLFFKISLVHHHFNAHELWQTLGDGEGQGSLACCRPWGCRESDTT